MVNENNYIGANTTLVGYAASGPEFPLYDKEGKRGYKRVAVAINEGYKKDGQWIETGTSWYDVMGKAEDLDGISGLVKGAKIRVDDAKQEIREYQTKDGVNKLGITLSYGRITVLEPAKTGSGSDSFTPDDDDNPF